MNTKRQQLFALYQQQRHAEANFANANGGSPWAKHGDQAFMMGGGPVVNEMDRVTRAYSITIKNTDETNDLVVSLFGFNEGLIDPFDGGADVLGTVAAANKGIIVTFRNEKHEVIKRRTANNPVLIEGMRYDVATADQLAEDWSIIKKDDNSDNQKFYSPQDYKSPQNFQSLTVEDKTFQTVIDADTRIQFLMKAAPSATQANIIKLIFFKRAAVNQTEVLKGESGVKVNTTDNVSGTQFY